MKMKALLIDDEHLNLQNLQALLTRYCPQVSICGTAMSAAQARVLIFRERPDILFLDIQMAGESGFDLLRSLGNQETEVIFVTAFDQYAIQAMRFAAVDYLLKPVDINELQQAVERADKQLSQKQNNRQMEHLLQILKGQTQKDEQRIALPTGKETRLVRIIDIVRCESSNNYTTFYLSNGDRLLVSKPLYEYDDLLGSVGFIRCHQSHLVNRQHVDSLKKTDGDYLLMDSGDQVPVARAKKSYVRMHLQIK